MTANSQPDASVHPVENLQDKRLHVVVLFSRIGPYHDARLKGAGIRLRVTAVEFSNVDSTYAWDLVEGDGSFDRVQLFPEMSVSDLAADRIIARVGEVLNQLRPQVVAIAGWSDRCSLAAWQWCRQRGIPVVVMSETTPWDDVRKWWKEAVKRRVVNSCSSALVGGRAHADYLGQLGFARDRIFFGYDAVDNEYFQEKAEKLKTEMQKEESRKKHGLPEKYFLASARFVEKKNLPRLIEAYARYRDLAKKAEMLKAETLKSESTLPRPSLQSEEGVKPWDLVLLGDGPLRASLASQVSSLKLQDCIKMPGFKQYNELPSYYGCASAFIHASTTEQWGLVVNEAMASGLPVLVSHRCGCAKDLVQAGRNGFTFDPGNVEELAGLMSKISALNFPLSEFGLMSREIISEWGPDRFADGISKAVETALNVPFPKARIFDRLLLRLLLMRGS